MVPFGHRVHKHWMAPGRSASAGVRQLSPAWRSHAEDTKNKTKPPALAPLRTSQAARERKEKGGRRRKREREKERKEREREKGRKGEKKGEREKGEREKERRKERKREREKERKRERERERERERGAARTIQKTLCCTGASNKLMHRRCNEQRITVHWSSSGTQSRGRTHRHEASELPRRSGRMMSSRVGGTSKMLCGVDLLARRLRAEAPSGTARTIQKGICCTGACRELLHRRCNEQPCTWNASQGFTFTEANKCTTSIQPRASSW